MKIRWEGESVKLRQDLGISVASQSAPILTFPRKRGKGPDDATGASCTAQVTHPFPRLRGEGWAAAYQSLMSMDALLPPLAGEGWDGGPVNPIQAATGIRS